jgi:U4/U6 small nuclear ribonucleoprotein PRP4
LIALLLLSSHPFLLQFLAVSNMAHNQGGNSHVAAQVEVMQLTEASQRDRLTHQAMLLDLEAKKRAFQVDVPTLPSDVRSALRSVGQPVRLFGENLANVRDRLRHELAKREILQERGIQLEEYAAGGADSLSKQPSKHVPDEEEVTKYSRATPELIQAREAISQFSIRRAKERLATERKYRIQWQRKRVKMTSLDEDVKDNPDEYIEVTRLDEECTKTYKTLRNMGLEGSQYGDTRPISSIATSNFPVAGVPLVATGSWSGTIKLWDGSSSELNLVAEKGMAHEDRIMGMAMRRSPTETSAGVESTMLATASIDLTAKLWKVTRRDVVMSSNNDGDDDDDKGFQFVIEEAAHLKGHAARLCSTAFHPQGDYVATTSFDHTWRLWDVATGQEVLLQDGHWKEVYGVGFHPDGSLCSTTDFGGIVQVWDLRTGKSVCHFLGHAKRVICTEFSPNGFQLATAGDDGTIKIWDLRKRKQFASIPAHSNMITQLRFDRQHNGEFLASSSFDGTTKVWSTRDWKMLGCGRGHEGKVMGVDLLKDSLVTCGFDKTIKLWR